MPAIHPIGYTTTKGMNQAYLIPMMNLYLKKTTALKANENGICNGLSAVFTKYAIEGRQAEFAEIIQAINKKGEAIALANAGKKREAEALNNAPSKISDSQISAFIQDVLIAYLPQEFDKKYCQDDGISFLKVNTSVLTTPESLNEVEIAKPMEKVYNIGMVAEPDDWAPIFDEMKANDTAWTIATPEHTVAVSVNNGKFEFYDPNNLKYIICETGADLARELSHKAFLQDADKPVDLLPLIINVMAHPDKKIDFTFPDKKELVQDLAKKNPESVNPTVTLGDGVAFDSLSMAATQNDVKMLEALLENGAKESRKALQYAAKDNRVDALNVLLSDRFKDNLGADRKMASLTACAQALRGGRFEAFERLIADKNVNDVIKEAVNDPTNAKVYRELLLKQAAASGSIKSVDQVINFLKANVSNIEEVQKIDGLTGIERLAQSKEVLANAKDSGNLACLNHVEKLASIELTQPKITQQTPLAKKPETAAETSSFIRALQSFGSFVKNLFSSVSSAQAKNAETKPLLSANVEQQKEIKDTIKSSRDEGKRSESDKNQEPAKPNLAAPSA